MNFDENLRRDWSRIPAWALAGFIAGALFTPVSRSLIGQPLWIAVSSVSVGAFYALAVGLVGLVVTLFSQAQCRAALPFRGLYIGQSLAVLTLAAGGVITKSLLPQSLWPLVLGAYPFYRILKGRTNVDMAIREEPSTETPDKYNKYNLGKTVIAITLGVAIVIAAAVFFVREKPVNGGPDWRSRVTPSGPNWRLFSDLEDGGSAFYSASTLRSTDFGKEAWISLVTQNGRFDTLIEANCESRQSRENGGPWKSDHPESIAITIIEGLCENNWPRNTRNPLLNDPSLAEELVKQQ